MHKACGEVRTMSTPPTANFLLLQKSLHLRKIFLLREWGHLRNWWHLSARLEWSEGRSSICKIFIHPERLYRTQRTHHDGAVHALLPDEDTRFRSDPITAHPQKTWALRNRC